jgi:DNA-binding response OmpR family regulator
MPRLCPLRQTRSGVVDEDREPSVRVLLADDETLLADTVAEGLRKLSMAVDVCYDGTAALERVSVNEYDVAILDRDMPGASGDEVCRHIVSAGGGPRVLILTAASSIRDRIDGFGMGADDYLTKPFAFAELAARVQALARRPQAMAPPVLDHHGVVLDVPRHQAFRDGQLLDLTPKEFAVLSVLMHSAGEVVSAEHLLEKAWDEHADPFTNAVRVAVMTLRRKLGDPPIVHTVPRVGYRFGG